MLGKRLSQLRKEKHKTQDDMAKLLGITRPAYTAYESGRRQPDYETLHKLAEYHDVSIDYLITGKEHVKEEKHSNLFFFDKDDLTEQDIEDIKKHIEFVKWQAKQRNKE
ncbi:helix-turn-helix domain-containing protein [Schinkia sp. CFF1]